MDPLKLHSKSDPATSHENLNQVVCRSSHIQNSFPHVVNFDEEDDFSTMPPKFVRKKLRYLTLDLIVGNIIRPSAYILQRVGVWLICFLVLCVCLVLMPIGVTLVYSCILTVALATLPLLIVSLLITRFFQFIKYGYDYKKLTNFKHLIRGWLYIDVAMVLVGLWIFFPIAKYVPSLKQVMVLDLPFTKWVEIITIMCGFYLISYVIYLFTHQLTRIINARLSLNVAQACSEIIDGLIFWWAEHEVIKRVPTFKQHEILGLLTRKWIRVSILVLIGYNVITLFIHLTVLSLRSICKQRGSQEAAHGGFWQNVLGKHLHTKYVVYFANGMKLSISFIMSSLLLLLSWQLYFGSRLDMKLAKAKSFWHFGLWTFVSLLVCSFLWLIKTFVLLAWEVNTVYHRLEPRIVDISQLLYFLGILGCSKHDIFRFRHKIAEGYEDETPVGTKGVFLRSYIGDSISIFFRSISKGSSKKLIVEKKEMVKNDLLILKEHRYPTMDDLQRASHYFLMAKKHLLKETYISDILKTFDQTGDNREILKKLIIGHREEQNNIEGKLLLKIFTFSSRNSWSIHEEEDGKEEQDHVAQDSSSSDGKQSNNCEWEHFVRLFPSIRTEHPIPLSEIQTWVERAHNQCMFLANTLSSADEVSGCLNKIISWLLIGATFIMWLLLTGLATTQVLVLVASPLLAATFVFGNTCKTLFEGILFVYVVHPLDVGDLCIIDKNMMEVTAIGIWTTTFSKVDICGTQEVVIYPNLELANRVIINHKTKFDWSDCVEFNMGYVRNTNINLQQELSDSHTISLLKKHN
ncbi:mechanosensitive ion channel protein 9 isoform X2 [Spinacia oleracea]|uniref:Mechanosensitive ion channel protein 9 isoform X2 n=1 Tax=Spinacia oleracea TaxID=3562 RepID=A0ABM3RUW5_SPIOL|nr:mechanosensitive ion channel protein 9-like isoform X2 [Spinacia oleracea]